MSRIGCGAVRSFFVRVRRRHLLELNYGQKDIKVFLTVVSSNLLPSVLCSVRVSVSTDTEGTVVLCSCVSVNRHRRHSCALFVCQCQQTQKAQLCSVRVSVSTDTEGTAVLCSCVTVNRHRRHSCAVFLCHCQQKQKAQLCCVLVSLSIKTEDTAVLCSCVTVNRNRRHSCAVFVCHSIKTEDTAVLCSCVTLNRNRRHSCALFVCHCQQKQKAQLGHSTDRPHCGHISSCFRTQQNVLEASFHVFSVSFCVLEPSNLTFKDQP